MKSTDFLFLCYIALIAWEFEFKFYLSYTIFWILLSVYFTLCSHKLYNTFNNKTGRFAVIVFAEILERLRACSGTQKKKKLFSLFWKKFCNVSGFALRHNSQKKKNVILSLISLFCVPHFCKIVSEKPCSKSIQQTSYSVPTHHLFYFRLVENNLWALFKCFCRFSLLMNPFSHWEQVHLWISSFVSSLSFYQRYIENILRIWETNQNLPVGQ